MSTLAVPMPVTHACIVLSSNQCELTFVGREGKNRAALAKSKLLSSVSKRSADRIMVLPFNAEAQRQSLFAP